jgi:ribose-phosphate pyrophosphokinase
MRKSITITSGGFIVPHTRLVFSGGEVQVKIASRAPTSAIIEAHVRSSNDLMELLLVTDALRRDGTAVIRLVMPYLPYARQDRVCAPGEAHSLRVFCDIINAHQYDSVEVWDAHSDVALALLNRCEHRTVTTFLGRAIIAGHKTVLVAPDAGAIKKVDGLSKTHGLPYVRADKSRSTNTGEITGTIAYSEHIGDADFLIVDDICDGGRTFIELAKALRPLTNGKVNLYITHGIFSRGTGVFDGLIDNVFVVNSFLEELPSNFHVIKD